MNPSGKMSAAVPAIVSLMVGCRSETMGRTHDGAVKIDASSQARTSCGTTTHEKLGVPFVEVCSNDLGFPSESTVAPSFWISAVPIGCSQGTHDTLECPPVIALAQPKGSSSGLRDAMSHSAAVIESDTAHSVCAMRFGGRLPTRTERSLARALLGLSTAVVTELGEGHRVRELAEWVTELPCDRPTLLPPSCGVGGFPWEASAHVPWSLVVACQPEPSPAPDDRAVIGVGGDCPSGSTSTADGGDARMVSCALRAPAVDRQDRRPAVSLRCARPTLSARETSVTSRAAFRCVIPEWR